MKKCKNCREPFTPRLLMQVACSPACALAMAVSKRGKEEKRALVQEKRANKAKREKLKSKAQWAKEAQTAVNKYVRLRDAHLGCVSCDKPPSWSGQWHASHFRSVGAASAVRFNLWNIHKSCSICNNWKSGNLSEYEPRLIEKIGRAKVDWLKAQNNISVYSVEHLKRIKNIFNKRAARLERNAILH